jgi:dTMP kinase
MAGRFISLDGIDGSGKSQAIELVARQLRVAGHDVIATGEPGGTQEGLALRKLILTPRPYEWIPLAELFLINAARVQHVEKIIRPAIAEGKLVLCDRFVASTLAYQGAGRGIAIDIVAAMHECSVGGFYPDLTIILDLDPAIGLARSRRRLKEAHIDEGRFESLDLSFHRRVRQSFLDQAAASPDRYTVIDADRSPEEVGGAVLARVKDIL